MTSIFELDIDVATNGTQGVIEISTEIPVQELRLVSYRVEFSSSADVDSSKILYINLPFIGHSQVNTNHNINGLPLLLGGGSHRQVQLQQTDLIVSSQKTIPEKIRYFIHGQGGTSGLQRVTLLFNYDIGAIH